MKITKKIKNQTGYAEENVEKFLGVKSDHGFRILNVDLSEYNDEKTYKVWVHDEDVLPFVVKITDAKSFEKALEKAQMYGAVKFVGLEACEVINDKSKNRYYRAVTMEVL